MAGDVGRHRHDSGSVSRETPGRLWRSLPLTSTYAAVFTCFLTMEAADGTPTISALANRLREVSR